MLAPADFAYLAKFLKDRSGLDLGNDKLYLLQSRLLPVAQRYGIKDVPALVQVLRNGAATALVRDAVEAMTTNESSFFRDGKPFDLFRSKVLPELLVSRAQQRSLRVWCAAASTGQEPYSLAMVLKEEAARLAGWRCEIVASDLSSEVLNRARSGLYNHFEVQRGLPAAMLVKYFRKKELQWELIPEVRSMVSFREHNLLNDPVGFGRFDVVFCRNVLIYFDRPTKARVLDSISQAMAPDGLLFLGGAETVLGITDRFRPHLGQSGLYARADQPAAQPAAQPRRAAAG